MTYPRRTQVGRRAAARTNLLSAACTLIGERGVSGFSIADVADQAEVSRGLPAYHFGSRQGLIEAAFAEMLGATAPDGDLGLPTLIDWLGEQTELAARGAAEIKITLTLIFDPASELAAPGIRERYWQARSASITRHLARASVLKQIRPEIEPPKAAEVVLGMLHGELNRVVTRGASNSMDFLDAMRRFLTAPPVDPKARGHGRTLAAPTQGGLFDAQTGGN